MKLAPLAFSLSTHPTGPNPQTNPQTHSYECRLCPDEFCLCRLCYHKHSTTPIHPHHCLPSTAPFHVTVLPPPVAPVVNGKDAGAEEEEKEELEEEEEDRGARAAMAVG